VGLWETGSVFFGLSMRWKENQSAINTDISGDVVHCMLKAHIDPEVKGSQVSYGYEWVRYVGLLVGTTAVIFLVCTVYMSVCFLFVMMVQWRRFVGRWQWIAEYLVNRKGQLLLHNVVHNTQPFNSLLVSFANAEAVVVIIHSTKTMIWKYCIIIGMNLLQKIVTNFYVSALGTIA